MAVHFLLAQRSNYHYYGIPNVTTMDGNLNLLPLRFVSQRELNPYELNLLVHWQIIYPSQHTAAYDLNVCRQQVASLW